MAASEYVLCVDAENRSDVTDVTDITATREPISVELRNCVDFKKFCRGVSKVYFAPKEDKSVCACFFFCFLCWRAGPKTTLSKVFAVNLGNFDAVNNFNSLFKLYYSSFGEAAIHRVLWHFRSRGHRRKQRNQRRKTLSRLFARQFYFQLVDNTSQNIRSYLRAHKKRKEKKYCWVCYLRFPSLIPLS